MMRFARRALMLVAFSLLASAATAHAERAWALWVNTHDTMRESDSYRLVRAHPTRQECDQEIRKVAKLFETQRYDGSGEFAVHGETTTWIYVCLPDTVDPRGPKGP
jgi:hypothetical protein